MTLRRYRKPFSAMGCPCETALYARSERSAKEGFWLVEKEVTRLDKKYSHYKSESLLSRVTERASVPGGCEVDSETAALLDYAEQQYQISGGLFDITSRHLTRLWDQARSLPDSSQIRSALKRTGWKNARWDGKRLKLPPEYELDLGGIVKEYAADRAAVLLKRAGFLHGFVDLGGDFHIIGPHPDGTAWSIGIRTPMDRNKAAAQIDVCSGGLASSGDYERFSEINGVRHSHFIDPRTGWALRADPERSAVSVVAPSCLLAGSIATLAMLLQGNKGRRILDESGLHWLELSRQGGSHQPLIGSG
jgi:thiamine biosynthesis lipoprotein